MDQDPEGQSGGMARPTFLVILQVCRHCLPGKEYCFKQADNWQDMWMKVWMKTQLDITNESQEVSPFPAGDHKGVRALRG